MPSASFLALASVFCFLSKPVEKFQDWAGALRRWKKGNGSPENETFPVILLFLIIDYGFIKLRDISEEKCKIS